MAVFAAAPLQLITSIPPVTRAVTAATIILSLLYFWLWWTSGPDFSVPYLVLVPGSSLFYPWTFVTSALVEISIYELFFTLLTIPASLRYLERLWGSVETLKFIVATVGVSNIIAFGLNWIEYFVLRYPVLLYGQWYHGQMALQIGVLVAFTQIIPEHQVQLFGWLKCRVKALPMAYVTLSTVMCLIGFQCPWIVIQFGWLVSWVWLRFYKKNDVGGVTTYGDRSETFALVHWFPPFIHTPITWLGNTVYTLASRFHLIPASSDIEAGGYSSLPSVSGVPGGNRAEAERRRAMALKALDQRLAGTSGSRPSSGSQSGGSRPSVANSSGEPNKPAEAETNNPTTTKEVEVSS